MAGARELSPGAPVPASCPSSRATARKGEPERPDSKFFKPRRQTVRSIYDTRKGQRNLEEHGGRTVIGVFVRVIQRLLALTTAIWHNDQTEQPGKRSLLTYDH